MKNQSEYLLTAFHVTIYRQVDTVKIVCSFSRVSVVCSNLSDLRLVLPTPTGQAYYKG